MLVEHLSFTYPCGREILRDVSFTAEAGDFLAILGNNGAGKSTLLRCLDHLLTPRTGSVSLDGTDLLALSSGELARTVAFVNQTAVPSRLSVYDTLLLGRKPYVKWGMGPQDRVIVEEILERMGLAPLAMRELDRLSGGERQKVLLARALVQQPRLLLLDEPTSNLDLRNQYEVLALVREICRERGITAVVVIHDLNLALRFCSRFLFLHQGTVLDAGGPQVVNPENLQAVYGIRAAVETIRGSRVVIPLP